MTLKRWYYRIFKHYRRLDARFVSYAEGDRLIKQNEGKPEKEQWRIAKEEDYNTVIGWVHLERRERILG